ncbi:hypothetical protein ABEF95_004397 [Exophiala dermatitidis]
MDHDPIIPAAATSIPRRRRQVLHCQFCPNTYHKREHLVRHERIHTGLRPYTCDKCDRAFARHDSLLRHERVHAPKARSTAPPAVRFSAPGSQSSAPQSPDINNSASSVGQRSTTSQARTEVYPPASNPDMSSLGFNNGPFFAETEDFFQYLLSTPAGWPTSLPTDISSTPSLPGSKNTGNFPGDNHLAPPVVDGSPHAVQQVGAMITDMSSNVTREISARGITSAFLDACLHQFFVRFNTTFPILHEHTFELRECGPFLLLNMVALGSLFFGSSEAISKGEFLWRLAQTAAATSWGDVFEGKLAPFRSHAEQIVTTALLGQTYAMLSRSRRLRTLCQSLHGLAFAWARQFGMFDLEEFHLSELPQVSASKEEKNQKWKMWVDSEIQRRTVLGLYIIDAQLARYAGASPVGKHVTNPLAFSGNDAAFQARNADDWIEQMSHSWKPSSTFRETFLSVFYPTAVPVPGDSQLSLIVLLEGFQAILSEHGDAQGAALGLPPISQIIDASQRLRRIYLSPPSMTLESKELLLRWHTFCLDIATDSVLLCQRLCTNFGISQDLFSAGRRLPNPVDLNGWTNTPDARRALLHAAAIQDLAEGMTLGRAYPTHLPASIFAAATIFCAYSKYGQPTVTTPDTPDWDAVWDKQEPGQHPGLKTFARSSLESSDSYRFVMGDFNMNGRTKTRNLRYSLLTLQMILQMISSQWGISHNMLDILAIWIGGVA